MLLRSKESLEQPAFALFFLLILLHRSCPGRAIVQIVEAAIGASIRADGSDAASSGVGCLRRGRISGGATGGGSGSSDHFGIFFLIGMGLRRGLGRSAS